MILDFKILSLWFVIEDWWYYAITCENNWFLNVLVKSNFATPNPFGSVSCFVVGICLSNYNFNSFLIHQASYSKEYQRYLMQRENLGSIWKIGRYPIKVSEVLSISDLSTQPKTSGMCVRPKFLLASLPLIWYATLQLSKRKIFDLLTPPQGSRVCVRTEYLLSWCSTFIPLIWYATWLLSEKKMFWPIDAYPGLRVWCVKGQTTCNHVATCVFPFNLICNMTIFLKSLILASAHP